MKEILDMLRDLRGRVENGAMGARDEDPAAGDRLDAIAREVQAIEAKVEEEMEKSPAS